MPQFGSTKIFGDLTVTGLGTIDSYTIYHAGNLLISDGGLTEKNFTTALKTKLDGIAAGATNTAVPFYTSAITKAQLEATLTGNITTHTHSYLSDTHDAKDVTAAKMLEWDTAFGWGDHAGIYLPSNNIAYMEYDMYLRDTTNVYSPELFLQNQDLTMGIDYSNTGKLRFIDRDDDTVPIEFDIISHEIIVGGQKLIKENDARLSDARTPLAHEHTVLKHASSITFGFEGLQWMDVSGVGGDGLAGNAPENPYSDWFHHIIANHNNSSGYYADLAMGFHQDSLQFRRVAAGIKYDWVELLHTGNLSTLMQPTPPDTLVLTDITSGINVTFTPRDAADSYEIWSSYDNLDFALIGILNAADVSKDVATTLFDDTNNKKGLIYYRVYAVKTGIKSTALQDSITTTSNAPDVLNLDVTAFEDHLLITYDIPSDPRVSHVEVKVDSNAVSGSLSEGAATLLYSGNKNNVIYNIPSSERAWYFQVWVNVITNT